MASNVNTLQAQLQMRQRLPSPYTAATAPPVRGGFLSPPSGLASRVTQENMGGPSNHLPAQPSHAEPPPGAPDPSYLQHEDASLHFEEGEESVLPATPSQDLEDDGQLGEIA